MAAVVIMKAAALVAEAVAVQVRVDEQALGNGLNS